MKILPLFLITFLFQSALFPSVLLADRGAMYEAWETGEAVITEQPSVLFHSFFYSEDGETPPPAPAKPRWERFKSLAEHGAITGGHVVRDSSGTEESLPEYQPSLDPFANRIDQIQDIFGK
ncbi:MAG TPA: hypothetical protein PKA63_11985 [Oligoflexia bacterium]|mgnify:CR=1 FL=1|nr:hypothetical protein [Oligoflexia bacterium]HMP49374.1 hypothetical protein [Oligoflexia bacterium]